MKVILPYKQKGVPVEPRPPRQPKDKYDLLTMKVGEARFWYGLTQQQISPYQTYFKRRGLGVWRTRKDMRDNREGVEITRIEDNTKLNGAASASARKTCSQSEHGGK